MKAIQGLLIIVIAIASLSGVHANGLSVSPGSFTVNKTMGQSTTITFTIQNPEPYDFYNITFEPNIYASFPEVPVLASGQSTSVTATILTDSTLNTSLRVKGKYYSTVGIINANHSVAVNPYSSSPCMLSITRGDSVIWTSSVQSVLNMRENPSNNPIDGAGSVALNQTYTRTFMDTGAFSYRWFVGSWGFPEVCTITILNDTGYVNDPNLDFLLNLDLHVNFPPTTVAAEAPILNYSLNFFDTAEGVLSVTNLGGSDAKAIHLSGEWITFSSNDFDLSPGQTRGIVYTIDPAISRTDETNKSYLKTITITGNFPAISKSVQVFIRYANLVSNSTDLSDPVNLITIICKQYPELCKEGEKVVYRYVSNGTGLFNVSITDEQWRDYNLRLINTEDRQERMDNYVKEKLFAMEQAINQTNAKTDATLEQVKQSRAENQDSAQTTQTAMIIALLVGAILVLAALILIFRKRAKEKEILRAEAQYG